MLRLKEVLIWVVALVLMGGLTYFVRYTRLGKAMRATAQDPEAARMMGVEVDRVVMTAFFLGSALAGACGMIFGLYYNLAKVDIGFAAGLRAFTAAVLGGIGNVPGAMLGGVLIGLIESLSGQIDRHRLVRRRHLRPARRRARVPARRPARPRSRPTSPERAAMTRPSLRSRHGRPHPGAEPQDRRLRSCLCWRLLLLPGRPRQRRRHRQCRQRHGYAALALGLNVVVGFAGLLDLGYAAFFAIGAYFYGILTSFQVMPHWSAPGCRWRRSAWSRR